MLLDLPIAEEINKYLLTTEPHVQSRMNSYVIRAGWSSVTVRSYCECQIFSKEDKQQDEQIEL
jgi:hypothetical protein